MKIKNIVLITVAALSLAACSSVPAGNVGVLFNSYGSDKGVDMKELAPGYYWVGPTQQLYTFPTYMQNYTWTKDALEGKPHDESISFQTVDGMTANADVGISYQIEPAKVTTIFQTYRRGIDEITDTFLRNMVRDAIVKEASSKPIEYVYGAGKAELIDAVQQDVSKQVEPIGIKIDKIYWIGQIRLPESVINSINAKNAATQMAQQRQNEVAQAEAEAKKKVAEAKGEADSILLRADAQAEANKKLAASITPELVQYRALEKWDGVLPKMTGSNAIPFVSVDNNNQK